MRCQMKFFLYEEQDGGCDYTIGCGKRLREIKNVKNLDEAIKVATVLRPNEYEGEEDECMIETSGDFAVSSARILVVDQIHEINIDEVTAAHKKHRKDKEEAEQLARDKAELERLSRKFGIKK